MEKFSFTKVFGFCLMVLGMLAAQTGYAQCPAGQANVEVVYTGGTFNGENSWLLWDATAGAELLCDQAASVPGTYAACATDGNTLELYAWETFGDNWNGATLALNANEDGSANGCDPLIMPLFGPDGNPGGADGNGLLNACPGGNPAGGALAFTTTITLTGCAGGGGGGGGLPPCDIECPESVIVATTDPGSDCTAFVEIPQPLNNSGCDLSTLTNDYNGTTDATDVYPLGTTLVTYSMVDLSTGATATCTVEVIVQDNTPPVIDCPGDLTINLSAGECEAYVDFDITAVDECNLQDFSFHQNGGLTLDPSNFLTNAVGLAGGGVVCGFVVEPVGYGRLFDLTALGVSPNAAFELTSVDFVTNFNSPVFGPTTINVFSFPDGTAIPTMASATLLATTDVNLPVSFANELHTVAISATVPPGEELFVTLEASSDVFGGTIFASEGGPFGGAPELAPSYVFGCPSLGLFPDYTDVDGFFPGFSLMLQVNGGILDSSVPVEADPGNPFASGDALPIGGPYSFTYTSEDLAGNVATCEFTVLVKEYPNPTSSLACNAPGVSITLDENCQAVVGADDILEGGPYGCYDDYLVELFLDAGLSQPVPTSPILTSQNIGQQIWVKVTDVDHPQQNSCWTWITVEDKIIPALECEDFSLLCTDSGIPGTPYTAGGTTATEMPAVQSIDNGTATGNQDVVDFPGAAIIDVDVAIETNHTWVGDLQISITSPSGTTVQLLDNWNNAGICGGCAGDGLDVVFDDESANTHGDLGNTCNNNPAAAGDFQAAEALSAFDGEDPNGEWTVTVGDVCGGDAGSVTATLIITSNSDQIVPFPVPDNVTIIGSASPYTLIGFDPCGPTTLSYVDVEVAGDCVSDPFIKQIIRTWTAVDASGNTTSCVQTIDVIRSTVGDVVFPENRDGLALPYFLCTDNYATDANGHPHPSASGYPTINGQDIASGDNCEFGLTYEDLVIPVCEGTVKILRTWTVLAWCPTTEVRTGLQVIKVVDNAGPELVCSPNQTISTGQNDCTASAIIAYPEASDVCGTATFVSVSVSNGTLNAQQTAVFGLPLGQTTVTFVYVDGCGNQSTCSYVITVTDQVPPVAICESFHVVGLTVDEPTLVPASIFDDGSYDNCGPVTLAVRRMDNPNCPGNDATPFGPYAPFYCCDVAGPNVMVELRVTDAAGNTNSCMVEVEVQDKLNPAIACPPNKVLDCWEDAYDLDLTGVATASDNCSVEITHFDNGSLDNCGEGTIFRIWTATDPGGRTASCVQRIDVINSTPFYISDTNCFNQDPNDGVIWPCDYNTNTCGPGLDPSVTGEPTIIEDACDLVGVTYEDVELPVTPPSCLKILRTWKVYDWCTFDAENFDPNNPTASAGYWEYTQIIKVLNSTAPVVTSSCEDVAFCSYDPNCEIGPATLLITAEDDCTDAADINYEYKIDTFNDGGDDIIGQGPDASGNYPIGTHQITWYVEDGCGNVTICSYLFVIADCKNPTPNLLNGIATEMMENCEIEIWAEDWDNPSSPSFDNCGIQEWLVQSPSQGPGQTAPPVTATPSWTFSGSGDLGTQTVDVWILDVNGNWSYVSTYILVQDNLAPFCTGPSASIAGSIENESADMVESVMVDISGNAPGLPDPVMTGATGSYGFPDLAQGGNYVVTPEKDDNPLNGVTTYDLVLISQHILGIQSLNSPYKMIAADINNSGNISTIDMVELRKLILFIDTEFQNNTSWRFVEAAFVFPDATNPFGSSFPEEFSINGLDAAEIADFIAIKTGDVNGSAQANGFTGSSDDRNANGDLVFGIHDQKMVAGEKYTVDFSAKDFANVLGYQFTLGFDNSAVELVDVQAGELSGLTAENFGMSLITEGVITTSWNNNTAVSLESDAVVFSVTFVANTNANLSEVLSVNSRYTKAEGYDNNANLLNIGLSFNTENGVVGGAFDLYQNQPNPFKSETLIGFNLPEAGTATLTVYDVSGRVLKVYTEDCAQGYNEVEISRADLSGTGVLYYQLDTENNSATKKMILID